MARPKLKTGPAAATMILSSGFTGGSVARSFSTLPFKGLHRSQLGNGDKAAAGIEPSRYSTPPMVLLQMGLPNQMANFSTTSPRQRAARKWPSS